MELEGGPGSRCLYGTGAADTALSHGKVRGPDRKADGSKSCYDSETIGEQVNSTLMSQPTMMHARTFTLYPDPYIDKL